MIIEDVCNKEKESLGSILDTYNQFFETLQLIHASKVCK